MCSMFPQPVTRALLCGHKHPMTQPEAMAVAFSTWCRLVLQWVCQAHYVARMYQGPQCSTFTTARTSDIWAYSQSCMYSSFTRYILWTWHLGKWGHSERKRDECEKQICDWYSFTRCLLLDRLAYLHMRVSTTSLLGRTFFFPPR